MSARRLVSVALVCMCGLLLVLVGGAGSAMAAPLFGEEGSEAGETFNPNGIAVDRATGDVYVGDTYNNRVDEFDTSGKFLLAWGYGVLNGADEPQICTITCRGGLGATAAGGFSNGSGPMGVAVDNDPLSASYGDVYVVDFGNRRVQKFNASGKFLLTFGGHVNETTGGNVCVVGEDCKGGTEGAGDGEFDEWPYEYSYIAMGPGGAVYVGDTARVQVFEASGAWRENISLAGLSATASVTALAVDASGDVFVKDDGVPGVHEFEPDGLEKPIQFDNGSESIKAITFDASGDLYVADENGGFHFLEYDTAGLELDSFGAKTLLPPGNGVSMVYDEALSGLLVVGTDGSAEGFGVWSFPTPPPGPLLETASESATPGVRGVATLGAVVNPEGYETTYRFEYVDEAGFQTSGYAGASSTQVEPIGSSFEGQAASAHLTGLTPGITYHYRIIATNSHGTATGPDQTFIETPPVQVEGPWTTSVAATSATFEAKIDPLGASTSYSFEYGTSATYGQSVSGDVSAGEAYVQISRHSQELLPDTLYHYRLVATNEIGTFRSLDRTFTTQPVSSRELTLPDSRAWELVSPPDKKGALIEPFERGEIQAANDGSAISYLSSEPIGENQVGNGSELSQIVSARVAGGWRSQDITIPEGMPGEGKQADLVSKQREYPVFSADLSLSLIEPHSFSTPLAPQATERTLYVRDNNGVYLPLVTPADVPPGTKFGATGEETDERGANDSAKSGPLKFYGATPDLSHVVFSSGVALTPEAKVNPCTATPCGDPTNLYEWSAGRLQLVNIQPNGETAPPAFLGLGDVRTKTAISNDGRWIVWTQGSATGWTYEGSNELYVRDMLHDRTYLVAEGFHAHFEAMSSDGSRIFFIERGDLYAFDTGSDTRIDLTSKHGAGERNAGVRDAVMGASEDGSTVYFVARGVFASGAKAGADNVYFLHSDGNEWTTTYIATLSGEDEKTFSGHEAPEGPDFSDLALASSRVSPDGRYLAFMSNASLTGYDNVDAVSGRPDEEVYEYDSMRHRLACVSCDPTGARPTGVFDGAGSQEHLLGDRKGAWAGKWLAASIPSWRNSGEAINYQPRYLSDSGRLFFEGTDALVPQDTNGLMDVYEYEPAGIGDCQTASVTFSEQSRGCANLISSGTGAGESAFLDASENGDDVFFITPARLTAADYDSSYDVYDAHVCSSAVPCVTETIVPPACATGDSCKAAPSPQPESFGPAPSATFSGAGNVVEPPTSAVKTRSLTNAQKRALGLAVCRKKRNSKQRALCERRVRKRYPVGPVRKVKATKKGRG